MNYPLPNDKLRAIAAAHEDPEVLEWAEGLIERREAGEPKVTNDYLQWRWPEHHDADATGYVYEHRLIAAIIAGRRLTADEQVHHKNWIRFWNTPLNLQICRDRAEHSRQHMKSNRLAKSRKYPEDIDR